MISFFSTIFDIYIGLYHHNFSLFILAIHIPLSIFVLIFGYLSCFKIDKILETKTKMPEHYELISNLGLFAPFVRFAEYSNCLLFIKFKKFERLGPYKALDFDRLSCFWRCVLHGVFIYAFILMISIFLIDI